jgi:hypothetical protein
MMRKSLWIVPLLFLFAAIGSTTARADTFDYYSISFSGADAPTAAGTVLTYDATTQHFTTPSFSLTFEGNVYTMDLDSSGAGPEADNPPTNDSIIWAVYINNRMYIDDPDTSVVLYTATQPEFSATANGGVILTAVAAPEIDPTTATSALALLIGVVMVLRGRRSKTEPESERA